MNSNSIDERLVWDLEDGRTVRLSYNLSTDFDVGELVRIDINNLMGEYITAPVLFNTVANLRSEAAEVLAKRTLEQKIIDKETYLSIKNSFKGQPKKPSIPELEAMVQTDKDVISIAHEVIQAQKVYNIMDNLYWSIKTKCDKLEHMYHKIIPEDFKKEIMEGQINNVLIRFKNALIK